MSPFLACQKIQKKKKIKSTKVFMPTRGKKCECGNVIEERQAKEAAGQSGGLYGKCCISTFYGPEPWQNATLNLIINYRAIAEGMGTQNHGPLEPQPHIWATFSSDCRQPQTQVNALEYTRLLCNATYE